MQLHKAEPDPALGDRERGRSLSHELVGSVGVILGTILLRHDHCVHEVIDNRSGDLSWIGSVVTMSN